MIHAYGSRSYRCGQGGWGSRLCEPAATAATAAAQSKVLDHEVLGGILQRRQQLSAHTRGTCGTRTHTHTQHRIGCGSGAGPPPRTRSQQSGSPPHKHTPSSPRPIPT